MYMYIYTKPNKTSTITIATHQQLLLSHTHNANPPIRTVPHIISSNLTSAVTPSLPLSLPPSPPHTARTDAVRMGQEMVAKNFIHHVTFDHDFKDEHLFYRLLGDGGVKALNAQLSYACIPRPGGGVANGCGLLNFALIFLVFSLCR